jgi:hypothetical protein
MASKPVSMNDFELRECVASGQWRCTVEEVQATAARLLLEKQNLLSMAQALYAEIECLRKIVRRHHKVAETFDKQVTAVIETRTLMHALVKLDMEELGRTPSATDHAGPIGAAEAKSKKGAPLTDQGAEPTFPSGLPFYHSPRSPERGRPLTLQEELNVTLHGRPDVPSGMTAGPTYDTSTCTLCGKRVPRGTTHVCHPDNPPEAR